MTRLFLAGDVMLGRGIDQILRHPGDPRLHENYLRSALDYVRLAERAGGPIPRGVGLDYVWGDAAEVIAMARPDWGIVNLETAITDDGAPAPKGINYRMSVSNAGELAGLRIGCFVLANNHMLDWGAQGLSDTLSTLRHLQLPSAGAGRDSREAAAPAVLSRAGAPRVLVFAMATRDSGVPRSWAAGHGKPGINLLESLDAAAVKAIKDQVRAVRRTGDISVASIHWGGNWGYDMPPEHQNLARGLIEEAGIDLVHGHSSHHPKGWEIHRGKLILYGCGDFLNDYEGIAGMEEYRGDLSAMYLVDLDETSGNVLTALTVIPFKIRGFRLNRAHRADADWLCGTLNRECRNHDRHLSIAPDLTIRLDKL